MSEILLADLPFAADALAPAISADTVSFHYGKHHAGYVKTLNSLIPGTPYENLALPEIVRLAARNGDTAVFNQAAQSWNHAFYWESLAPADTGGAPEGPLAAAVDRDFGGLEPLLNALKNAAVKRFGSGWAWLVRNPDGRLAVESTANADTPLTREGVTPLLVVDVWEHAYYLDWQNRRADYVQAVVSSLLDWCAALRRWQQV